MITLITLLIIYLWLMNQLEDGEEEEKEEE